MDVKQGQALKDRIVTRMNTEMSDRLDAAMATFDKNLNAILAEEINNAVLLDNPGKTTSDVPPTPPPANPPPPAPVSNPGGPLRRKIQLLAAEGLNPDQILETLKQSFPDATANQVAAILAKK